MQALQQKALSQKWHSHLNKIGLRGWIVFVVAVVILMMIILYSIQEITGIPAYSIIGDDASDEAKIPKSKILAARAVLGGVSVVLAAFMWDLWSSGNAASVMYGTEAASGISQSEQVKGAVTSAVESLGQLQQQNISSSLMQMPVSPTTSPSMPVGSITFPQPGTAGAPGLP